MPASEHNRSQCVHGTQAGVKRGRLAQRAGGRRRCGSGQGLGAPHLAIAPVREFKLTNGRRPPLSGALALYEPHMAGGRRAPPYV